MEIQAVEVYPDNRHSILNPQAREITVPAWVLIKLRSLRLIVWNRIQRRNQISPAFYALVELLAMDCHHPKKALRAFNPEMTYGMSWSGKRLSALIQILGRDCSGPNTFDCRCRECVARIEDADRTASPFTINRTSCSGIAGAD